ncbi:uroporphyrinogen-III synthase [Roseibium sp.]|uniref:uroporphyrinogen-III synthase n=1 Tax=Roseibium sp. TaxID=1936156 RepID=UPI003D099BDE
MRFLVTRPQPDCKRTADKLRAAGHLADEAPLLRFRADPPGSFDLSGVKALAVTSRRAVTVLSEHAQMPDLKALPVFAVGESTAEACRRAGFESVTAADGDVASLASCLLDHRGVLAGSAVLYPAAEERAGDLEGLLDEGGMTCRLQVVYRMEAVDELPEAVVDALISSAYDGVLVYSKRTAEALLDLLTASGLNPVFSGLRVFAISQQAAGPLSGHMKVHVAGAPNETALLKLALTEC